jgi:hypothetical protein
MTGFASTSGGMSTGAGASYAHTPADKVRGVSKNIPPADVIVHIKEAYAAMITTKGADLNTAMDAVGGFKPGVYFHAGNSRYNPSTLIDPYFHPPAHTRAHTLALTHTTHAQVPGLSLRVAESPTLLLGIPRMTCGSSMSAARLPSAGTSSLVRVSTHPRSSG